MNTPIYDSTGRLMASVATIPDAPKFAEPHILDKLDDLVDTLNDMVADPMWPDHVEIKKETLVYTINLLNQLASRAA